MSEKILFYFRSEKYGWLSNFERSEQIVDYIIYNSNEHYYQSEKGNSLDIRNWIIDAPNPFLAMKAGRSLRSKDMVKDWYLKKIFIMKKGLRAKYTQNNVLKQKLLATKDAELHENSPTDLFWGIKGQDWLGKLLMEIRDELKKYEKKL